MNAVTEPQNFDQPLFKTSKGALLFAFNFTHGTLKKCTLAQFMPADRVGRGLVGMDGALQAGLIRAEVGQLSLVRRMILTSRYAPAKSPCSCRAPCCTGFRLNREWAEAIDWLAEHGLRQSLPKSPASYRLRHALVARYFGQDRSMIKISEECHVNRDTASDTNKRVVEFLGVQERAADVEIQGKLEVAGVIEA